MGFHLRYTSSSMCVYDVQPCTGGHPVRARLTDCRGHGSAAYLIASRTTVPHRNNYIIFKKNIASSVRTEWDNLVTAKSALLAAEEAIFKPPGAISVPFRTICAIWWPSLPRKKHGKCR